jgi:hypothetical protein
VALTIPYVYDYITKLFRAQAEVILNHVNPNVRGIGQGEVRHGKPNTNFTFVVDRPTVYSCINFVIGGVAKNFLPLLLKVLDAGVKPLLEALPIGRFKCSTDGVR